MVPPLCPKQMEHLLTSILLFLNSSTTPTKRLQYQLLRQKIPRLVLIHRLSLQNEYSLLKLSILKMRNASASVSYLHTCPDISRLSLPQLPNLILTVATCYKWFCDMEHDLFVKHYTEEFEKSFAVDTFGTSITAFEPGKDFYLVFPKSAACDRSCRSSLSCICFSILQSFCQKG